MKEKFDLIKNKIDTAKNIALICHIRPDGDALGSSLALQNYILTTKKCSVFCDDTLPPKYNFLTNYDLIRNDEITDDFDLLISLDGDEYANSYRLTKSGQNSFSKVYNNVLMLKDVYNN